MTIARTEHLPIEKARIPTIGILSYLFPRSDTHKHQGLDFPAPLGTPVRSVTSGVVSDASKTLAEHFSGYGRVVQIKYSAPSLDSVWVLYAHLDQVMVKKGDTVSKGQQIGTVGNTCFTRKDPGKACGGMHLHFEVRNTQYLPSEGNRLDPVIFLARHGEITPQVIIQLKNEENQRKQSISFVTGLVTLAAIGGIVWFVVRS